MDNGNRDSKVDIEGDISPDDYPNSLNPKISGEESVGVMILFVVLLLGLFGFAWYHS